MPRFAACSFLALVLACTAAASGSASARVAAPAQLHAFVLRATEAVKGDHTYSQMPAFAWNPVPKASTYQLQLATNPNFSDTTILLDAPSLTVPVASLQLQVPWMTGSPYALWVHVRAVVKGRQTAWSKPFGFNTSWQQVPKQESSPAGLIRWTPVEGATAYEVWLTDIHVHFTTFTNVADEREYWTFHPAGAQTIHWRVRAVRATATATLPNGVTIAKYGPYSPEYVTTTSGTLTAGPLQAVKTLSDLSSSPKTPRPHALMPGFSWKGTDGIAPGGTGQELWRVYVFSDRRCVNPVMTGSIVGGPAWAPRAIPPMALPGTRDTLQKAHAGAILKPGAEGATFMADLTAVTASEGAVSSSSSAPSAGSSSGAAQPGQSSSGAAQPGQVELPDSGWPAGRYWWTVVPVAAQAIVADPVLGPTDGDLVEYHETELPEDTCARGRVWPFGLRSAPATTTSTTPFASGLTAGKRLVAAAGRTPRFVAAPLVTWTPALGAQSYEIELSRHLYPWVAVKKQTSVVTSAVLGLTKNDRGTWYYRVRGVNPNLPANAQKMTWSGSASIAITGNQFVVIG
jgi:hypothetical protein